MANLCKRTNGRHLYFFIFVTFELLRFTHQVCLHTNLLSYAIFVQIRVIVRVINVYICVGTYVCLLGIKLSRSIDFFVPNFYSMSANELQIGFNCAQKPTKFINSCHCNADRSSVHTDAYVCYMCLLKCAYFSLLSVFCNRKK